MLKPKHSIETEEDKIELGIHTIKQGFNKKIEETITKVIDGGLRSGKRVEFDGSLVILGDVNAGAEVIAKEHIIVFGTLRGLAHAGARGNKDAMIIANKIDVVQLRIADIVKEMERPVFEDEENEEEVKETKKDKKKKKEEEEIIPIIEDIKTRAYIKGEEIILE